MRKLAILFLSCLSQIALAADGGQLFREGMDGEASLANGQVLVPARQFPCANCHGDDARGNKEGATVMPPITMSSLTDDGRADGSYDFEGFLRAVREGVRPDGSEILSAMPRYDISDAALAKIWAYLSLIETKNQTGIESQFVVLPPPNNADYRAGLVAALERFREDGGAYGRYLKLADEDQPPVNIPEIYEAILDAVNEAEVKTIIRNLLADNHREVAFDISNEALESLFTQAGITRSKESDYLVIVEEFPENVNGKTVFLAHHALADEKSSKLNEADAVFVGLPQNETLMDVLIRSRNGEYFDGYVAGYVMGEALRMLGRNVTASELSEMSEFVAQEVDILLKRVDDSHLR